MSLICPTGSTAPVLTLPTCAHTIAGRSSRASSMHGERVHPHPPLGVRGDRLDRRGADAEEAQRPVDGAVPLLAREHADPRGTPQPRRAHVPSGPAEHGVQGGRQPGEVGHLRAGHEPDRRVRRQAEQVGRPARPRPPRPRPRRARGRTGPRSGPRRRPASRRPAPRASHPPTTKPKNRPLPDAITPGPAAAARSATTSRASSGRSGSGPPSAARSCARSAAGWTGRSGRPSR